ncbi:MAG TPA: sugar phosphate nucleotidyltransferase [Gaiellales bacterium]|nr:sugar phosphate nucleotidyltransferase [Gaiellales bacterium]
MKAVVMAGGEGTRLRPLTSNQPKPMVPVAGKPCMEHIIELLRAHGMTDIVVTLAYLPQVIRGYFDDGGELGVELHYSVEETPLGTAGSVKNAAELLDETFLVISGDALCDFDLGVLVEAHRARGAAATLALVSVENPLEFGVVITDADGRVERFLEKPSWGQVFSDTINTGVYVLEPEVLRAVPDGRAYDFSKQLFPELVERGKPIYGHLVQGYWQDIGNLDQYRQANFDALDGRVQLELSGIRLRDNVVLGDGVQLPDLGQIEGPAFIGNYCQIDPGARIGPYAVLGQNVVVKEGASIVRSIVDSGGYIGRSARVEGTILGKGVDVRAHAVLNEGAAVGDECSIGAQALIAPEVKVYPFKTIEAGAAIHTNLIWESRGITTLFGRDGAGGLVNVDITPEVAARLGAAYGTTLPKGARVVTSRDAHPASRMVKRAIISGLVSTGLHISDLRVALPAVNRHEMRVDERVGALHVRVGADDPDMVQVVFFQPPGILATEATLKGIERAFSRQEFRRVSLGEIGTLTYPTRATASYVQELLGALDSEAVAERAFRLVLNYSFSAASLVMPSLVGDLGIEMVALNAFVEASPSARGIDTAAAVDDTARLVRAVGADLGIVIDNAAERVWLIDETGEGIPPETTLLLLVRELSAPGRDGALLVPVTETRMVEEIARGNGVRVRRTKASQGDLLAAATSADVVFAGASGGGYVFPDFLPAYDAVMSIGKILEVVAHSGRSLSDLVRDLPSSTLVHERSPCPWQAKGTAMRQMIEAVKGLEVDHTDGIKVYEPDGWAQIIPDPDEPVFHIYAEGETREDSRALEAKYRAMLDEFVAAAV